MDIKKIGTYVIFLALLAISVVIAIWFYYKYIAKPVTSAPSPSPTTPPNSPQNPICNTAQLAQGYTVVDGVCTPPSTTPPSSTTDPNIGKEAYAGTSGTLYNLQGGVVKQFVAQDDLGKVTGVDGNYFILDNVNKVDSTLVMTR